MTHQWNATKVQECDKLILKKLKEGIMKMPILEIQTEAN